MILYRLWREGLFRRIDREKILFFLGMTPTPLLLSRREPLIRKVHWLRALVSPSYARSLGVWLRYRMELFDGDQG